MTRPKFTLWILVLFIVMFAAYFARAEGFTYIGKDRLKAELGNPDVTIIDVRVTPEWDASQLKIEGARRESPAEVSQWMAKYPKNKTIVLYCA